jgi:hypothetical protein
MENLENFESLIESTAEELRETFSAQIADIRSELASLEDKLLDLSWRVSGLEEVD